MVGRHDASTDAVCDALRAARRSVVRAADGRTAVERIVALPTLAALVVDVEPEGVAAAEALAVLARKVIPELAVIYLTPSADAATQAEASRTACASPSRCPRANSTRR